MAATVASGLSLAALALRGALSAADVIAEDKVRIGDLKQAETATGDHDRLNLFFYRVEPGGAPADAKAADPYHVRVFCLVTAFCQDDSDSDSKLTAGEKELRLIGNVLACFHAHPLLALLDDTREIAKLQVVPTPLTLEAMNNLWSTQKDVAYRLSVAYELALIPLRLPELPLAEDAPLVLQIRVASSSQLTIEETSVALSFVGSQGQRSQAQLVTTLEPIELQLEARGPEQSHLILDWEQWRSGRPAPRFEAIAPTPLAEIACGLQPVRVNLGRVDPGQIVITASAIRLVSGVKLRVAASRLLVVIDGGGA